MTQLFAIISDLVTYKEPTKSFIVCFIFTVVLLTSVLVIGFIIDKIELYQIKLLTKLFGQKPAMIICNRLTFPGIFVHEMSHAIFAAMLGAQVTKIKLISFRNDGRLGWVEYRTRGSRMLQGLQNAWSSCAPTIVGLILEYFMFKLLKNNLVTGFLPTTLVVYLMISVANHMSMSGQDIRNYIRGSWVAILVLYVILLWIRF